MLNYPRVIHEIILYSIQIYDIFYYATLLHTAIKCRATYKIQCVQLLPYSKKVTGLGPSAEKSVFMFGISSVLVCVFLHTLASSHCPNEDKGD